ncbi:MAG: protein kinase, partial [Lentisphaerota bacterium]
MDAAPDLAEGNIVRIDNKREYMIGKEVGKGGMGMVFTSNDSACQREVAMKVLSREEIRLPGGCERFLKEARITARLEHPNIVPVHEVGVTDQRRIYYTMKYVRGLTLTQILMGIRRGDMHFIESYPLSRLLNIFQKVCDAMAFAHSRGIVHRDLKPENLMIGDYGEVLVMDWGLSERLVPSAQASPAGTAAAEQAGKRSGKSMPDTQPDNLGGATTRLSTSSVQGTPGFIAPERLEAQDFIGDVRSDIYSLGATLYSILTLRAPVSGPDMKTVLARILAGDIQPPSALNETVSEDPTVKKERPHCPGGMIPTTVSDIAMKAMATNPADRYASVKAMQADIEDYQLGKIWRPVVDEDFSGGDAEERWDISGGRHEIKPGDLCIYEGEPQVVVYKTKLPIDVRLELECYQDAVNPASLGCFISAIPTANTVDIPSSGYKFEFGAFDNTLHVLSRVETQLARQKAVHPLVRGEKYRVSIERVGARLRAVVNDEEIFNLLDPDPLSGMEHAMVGLVGWRSRTHISRIRIQTLSAPHQTDLLEFAERQFQRGKYDVATVLYQEILDSYPDPERREKARNGLARATRRETQVKNLHEWRAKLEQAWHGIPFHLRLSNDGLALEIPPGSISSLAPIAGIPLTTISFQNNAVSDLAPLQGMPLVVLNCTSNPLTSLTPLAGAPLESVMCDGCRIDSLEPLAGKNIALLNCADNRIASLEPIRSMPLTFLCCWGNQIDSLEPVRGMKLTTLICSANRITDLEPIRGMPITTLICNGNRISSLDPLRGMPLKEL